MDVPVAANTLGILGAVRLPCPGYPHPHPQGSPVGAEYLSIMLTSLACAGLLVHSSPSIRPLPPHPSSPLPFPSLPAASAALHAASLLEPRRKKARK